MPQRLRAYRGQTTRVLSQSIERNFLAARRASYTDRCLAVCVFHVAALRFVENHGDATVLK
jgi:hypothetical protein